MGLNKVHFKSECLVILLFITEDNIVSIGAREVRDTRFRNTAINFSNLGEQHCYFLGIHELDLDLKTRNKSRL